MSNWPHVVLFICKPHLRVCWQILLQNWITLRKVNVAQTHKPSNPVRQGGQQEPVIQAPVRLMDLLMGQTIRLNLKAKYWKQAVCLAGQILLETGAITPSYIDAMIQAVEEIDPYIVITPGIALAHARPEDGVRQMYMSLITLDTPVEFGAATNDPVDIVIAFGAVDKETKS